MDFSGKLRRGASPQGNEALPDRRAGRQRTLFRKYLSITSFIIVISFCFLGLVMIVFVSQYWTSEKREVLSKNAYSVADVAGNSVLQTDANYTIDGTRMQIFMTAFANNIGADIFLTDRSGVRLVSCYGSASESDATIPIASDVMERALSDGYTGQGTLGGVYRSPHYVVGAPIVTVNRLTGDEIVIGAVFAAADMSFIGDYRMDVFRIFLFAALAAFLLAFCVAWLFSYSVVKPLREMAVAARRFGAGDFSMRVPVHSRDEIGELALAFNNMASSLSSGEYVRRNFIANVSHELKTPMTTIAGFIDGILDGTIPPERQDYYLTIVSQEVKRLSRLVRTMLDLSRIDNGELKLRPARFDLSATLVNALLTFEKNIDDKRIEIRGLEDLPATMVDGDPDMIHQVVYNLIENAVKFTNPGGYIEFRVGNLPDRTEVAIRNSGAGIAPEDLALIFDRFYKTDKSRSQDKNGMGLGLYIVKTIVRLHGGEITVSSVENEYTEFRFYLPRQPESQRAKENSREFPKLKEPKTRARGSNKNE